MREAYIDSTLLGPDSTESIVNANIFYTFTELTQNTKHFIINKLNIRLSVLLTITYKRHQMNTISFLSAKNRYKVLYCYDFWRCFCLPAYD